MEIAFSECYPIAGKSGGRTFYRKGQTYFIIPNDILSLEQLVIFRSSANDYMRYTKGKFFMPAYIRDAYQEIKYIEIKKEEKRKRKKMKW
jgi:hypothetical protein